MRMSALCVCSILVGLLAWSTPIASAEGLAKTTPMSKSIHDENALILTLPNGELRLTLGSHQQARLPLDDGGHLVMHRDGDDMIITLAQADMTRLLYRGMAAFPPNDAAQIRFADMNFDGRRDLLIQTSTGYAGVNVLFSVFLSDEDGFVNAGPDFDMVDLSNPEIDTDLREVRASLRDGPNWYHSVYKVKHGAIFLDHTMSQAGDDMHYVRFYEPDGSTGREMITQALTDDPRSWEAIRVRLPDGALLPLRTSPDADSPVNEPFPADSQVLLKRLGSGGAYLLLEHAETEEQGWIKTEWLPLPDGLSLY